MLSEIACLRFQKFTQQVTKQQIVFQLVLKGYERYRDTAPSQKTTLLGCVLPQYHAAHPYSYIYDLEYSKYNVWTFFQPDRCSTNVIFEFPAFFLLFYSEN